MPIFSNAKARRRKPMRIEFRCPRRNCFFMSFAITSKPPVPTFSAHKWFENAFHFDTNPFLFRHQYYSARCSTKVAFPVTRASDVWRKGRENTHRKLCMRLLTDLRAPNPRPTQPKIAVTAILPLILKCPGV